MLNFNHSNWAPPQLSMDQGPFFEKIISEIKKIKLNLKLFFFRNLRKADRLMPKFTKSISLFRFHLLGSQVVNVLGGLIIRTIMDKWWKNCRKYWVLPRFEDTKQYFFLLYFYFTKKQSLTFTLASLRYHCCMNSPFGRREKTLNLYIKWKQSSILVHMIHMIRIASNFHISS